ncbi:MAG: DUF2079 domain-containing protein [Oscillospiraceae bacterium]|nr:DUF2079 domain-containing protein [Oscillospiraceae bacterium]
MSKQKSVIRSSLSLAHLIRKGLLSWLFAALVEYALLPSELRSFGDLRGLEQVSFGRVVGLWFFCFALLLGFSRSRRAAVYERWGFPVLLLLLGSLSLIGSFSLSFLILCVLLVLLAVGFALRGWEGDLRLIPTPRKGRKACIWATVGLSLLFFLLVSGWTVGRVYSFSAPTYDFGIFSQMFYNMKTSGLPLTTVERDGLLSHFAVHVSPIYYLLLPFYWLFPAPVTLQVLQAAVMTSAVIPLWLLGKQHGLGAGQRMLLCALLLLFPAFAGGAGYDIHENCFLTPLLLWLFYTLDHGSRSGAFLAGLLTLMVKEDAAVYVAVIGLWQILKAALHRETDPKSSLINGFLLLGLSIGWFLGATTYLSRMGDGVMTGRYKNLLYGGSSSLLTVIKAVLLQPMRAFYECVDPEKLPYIAGTLLPLLGLPLWTRRYERWILLIPYLLVNLLSDYPYQHDIFYQYSFGSAAFLLYLTAVNLADLRGAWKAWTALSSAVLLCGICFGILVVPKALRYPTRAIEYSEHYGSIRQTLDLIPKDASVAAGTFYTTYLSQREVLYDIRYCSKEHLLESEFVVLPLQESYKRYATGSSDNGLAQLQELLESSGYQVFAALKDQLMIYRREQ